jgi:hypothetical protein
MCKKFGTEHKKTGTDMYHSPHADMREYRQVLVDGTDTVVINKEDKICILIDVATCSDRNVAQKEAEK